MNAAVQRIALVGNPNCGKTSLFNQLTGARQKVANYAGVTVERKEGRLTLPSGRALTILDLPGAYSLTATSPDEAITRAVCLGEHPGEPAPDLVVCVADATNLRLHLRFVLEVKQLGRPMLLVLNMMDAAQRRGITIDVAELEARLGLTVVGAVAVKKTGVAELVQELDGELPSQAPVIGEATDLHEQVRELLAAAVTMPRATDARDDALDRLLLHPVLGIAFLAGLMFLIFQAVFAWAEPFMGAIEGAVGALGELATATLPEGLLKSLLLDGIFAGLGGVLVFLPQILILFLFILLLEESGYLPRAAFLLDRPAPVPAGRRGTRRAG